MKFLVSYMYPIDNTETNYGHTEVTVDYWDTLVVLDLISGARGDSVDTSNVIITSVFQIPESRFSKEEKAYQKRGRSLKHTWRNNSRLKRERTDKYRCKLTSKEKIGVNQF